MIRTLRIQNFALIDEVEVNFNAGFTVITGETGSGKSILVNALNLLLGERANFDVIGNAGNKATVEGEIDLRGFGLSDFFLEKVLVSTSEHRGQVFIHYLNFLLEFFSRLLSFGQLGECLRNFR